METHVIIEALRQSAQALKDIINAANNGEPYNAQELEDLFTPAYAESVRVIEGCGHTEIA